jgi:hypothetical protein
MKNKQQLSKTLAEYQPNPGPRFYQRMEGAPWKTQGTLMTNHTSSFARFGWQIAVILLLVLAGLSLTIPTVRASISAWLGLSVAPSNQMPAPAVTLAAVTPDKPAGVPSSAASPAAATATAATPEPAAPRTPSFKKPEAILQLSPQAGWEILAPGHLPDGYQFQSAYFDKNNQMVILTYLATRPLPGATDASQTASKTITLLQAQHNDFLPLQIAPDSTVTDVLVNGQPAAFTVGAWDSEFVKDDQDPNGGKMVSTWRNDLLIKNLFWQVGKVYLAMITDDEILTQQDLINMAGSVE